MISHLMGQQGEADINGKLHWVPLEVYDQLAIDNGFSGTKRYGL